MSKSSLRSDVLPPKKIPASQTQDYTIKLYTIIASNSTTLQTSIFFNARFSLLLYNEWIFHHMASRSKLSASLRTRERTYLFFGIEKTPFSAYSVRTLVTDHSEMPVKV